jgi:UDP-glucose 4-epimerase
MKSEVYCWSDEFPTLQKKRCLVLGGGGFVGTNLCNALIACKAEVQAFGRGKSFPRGLDQRVIWTHGELDDLPTVARIVEGQDVIFQLIGSSLPASSNRDPAADLVGTVLSNIRLLDLFRSERPQKFVFPSSGGTVYGIPLTIPIQEEAPTDPISAYGISKLTVEKYLALYQHMHGLDYQVLRIANPYGRYQSAARRQGVVAALVKSALAGQPLEIWGTGEVVRDFIHVTDVVAAMLTVLDYTGPYKVLNVGSGVGTSIAKVASDIEVALACAALPRRFRGVRTSDVPINVLDISRITSETCWRPRILWQAGLADTIDWMRREGAGSAPPTC